ncbi:MAG: methyltransferase domain-containing protein [Bacteroidetes bacterium]|nr:methyltransferase domain-containing protein [Bacteroidota bacterium]
MPLGEKLNYIFQKLNNSHNAEETKKKIFGLLALIKKTEKYQSVQNASVVEIGTGWQPIYSLLLYLLGAQIIYSYDHLRHVRFGLTTMIIQCIGKSLDEISEITSVPKSILVKRLKVIKDCSSLEELFSKANIIYIAPGDASKTDLENETIDIVFSYNVLEHISKEIIYNLILESKRILKESGIAIHIIGLYDHYATFDKKITKVNFLKFSEFWWTFFVLNTISYHNRLREKQFLKIFEQHGAKIISVENRIDPDDLKKLKTMKIDKSFQGMSFEELAIHRSEIILSF